MVRCSALRMAAKAGLKCRCRRACSTSTHWLAASGASCFHSLPPACFEFAGLTGLSARRGVLWHLSKMLCPNLDERPINRLQEGIGFQVFAVVAPMLGEGG